MPAGEIEIRDRQLRGDVGRGRGRRGARRLQVGALHAIEQSHLSETGACIGVTGILRESLLVGRDRARVVARLDRVVRLGVQRGQRRLLDLCGFALGGISGDLDRAGHAVLCGQLQQLCEDLAHLLLGHRPGEQRHRLAADQATTIGIDWARKACDSWGFASTSTLASTSRPPASMTSFSSTGVSCLQGPHHSAQRSMTTGTVRESSSTCGKVSSVTSITSDGTAAAGVATPAGGSAGRFRSAERSTAPRRAAPEAASVT